MRAFLRDILCSTCAAVILTTASTSAAEPTAPALTEKETSSFTPPKTTWPVYVLGGIGIVGLGTAAIFGGLAANSDHAVDVTTQAILRKGKPLSVCDGRPVEIPYGDVCAQLAKNKRVHDDQQGVLLPSLIVGISATALAVGWFFLAPKESGDGAAKTRVVPWVGVGTGGAALEGRF